MRFKIRVLVERAIRDKEIITAFLAKRSINLGEIGLLRLVRLDLDGPLSHQSLFINMPYVKTTSWKQWKISWRDVRWSLFFAAVAYFSCTLINKGYYIGGGFLLLVSIWLCWECLKTLWLRRIPFIFEVRGNRKVDFSTDGRDGRVFKENGREVKINTELWGGKISRGIYASSIKKWEPPHEHEPLTDEQKADILALLCEEYDYEGTGYEVVMSSKLMITMPCPRCGQEAELNPSLSFGRIEQRTYRVGDKVEWQPNWPTEKGGRPENGNIEDLGGGSCPKCKRDYRLRVVVKSDVIESAIPDFSKPFIFPDNSEPIIDR